MINMAIKDQLLKIKENWLLVAAVLIILFISTFGGGTFAAKSVGGFREVAVYDSMRAPEALSIGYDRIPPSGDFAPEVEERKITKTASLSTEVERGTFGDAETKLKAIVAATDSFILNENVNKQGFGKHAYYSGFYQIKVEGTKYDAVISQLKDIGEVISFNENAQDVTGTFVSTEARLEAEKSRLQRYQQMYKDAKDIDDKIQLSDRIFNQERTIKYLEDSLKNIGRRVEYTTISFSMREKQSEYVGVVLVKFSQLVRQLVVSINSLLSLIFVTLHYALVALLVWLGVRLVKKR